MTFGMGWEPLPPRLTHSGWVAGSQTAGKGLGHSLGSKERQPGPEWAIGNVQWCPCSQNMCLSIYEETAVGYHSGKREQKLPNKDEYMDFMPGSEALIIFSLVF